MKRKVLFFLPGGVGGAERMSITIAKFLDRQKYDVKFVIVSREVGEIVDIIPKDYKWLHLKVRNIWDFVILRFILLLRKERPYAVFSTNMYMNPHVLIAAHCVSRIRKITRNDNYVSTLNALQFFLCKWTYGFADVVIAQQDEMKMDIISNLKVAPSKIVVRHNPIDTELIRKKLNNTFSPYPQDEDVNFLSVARFDRTKGQDILAKAFVEVYKKNNKVHLYYVGDYQRSFTFFKEVKQLIFDNDIQNNVHFIGYSSNPYIWMKYCDCFVLPSRVEGLPNSLIEAQYLGVPCVATRCIPVIDRIITNGINGYTVPSEDYKAMADAMFNALKLGHIRMTYSSSTKDDYDALFDGEENEIQHDYNY